MVPMYLNKSVAHTCINNNLYYANKKINDRAYIYKTAAMLSFDFSTFKLLAAAEAEWQRGPGSEAVEFVMQISSIQVQRIP